MTRKQNNNNRRRRRPRRRGRRRRNGDPYNVQSSPNSRGQTGLTQPRVGSVLSRVHGLVNPFSSIAEGVRIPDESLALTLPHTQNELVAITTDANGNASFQYNPASPSSYRVASSITGTTITWGSYSSMDYMAGSLFQAFRIVCAGVRFYSTVAPTDASGIVNAFVGSHIFAGSTDLLDSMQGETVYRYPVAGCNIHWVAKPKSDQYRHFHEVAATVGVGERHAWNQLMLTFTGAAASTTIGYVEIIERVELIPNTGEAVTRLATPSPPHSPAILHITDKVRHTVPEITNDDSRGSEEHNATVAKHVSDHGSAIASAVGGFAGKAAGTAAAGFAEEFLPMLAGLLL